MKKRDILADIEELLIEVIHNNRNKEEASNLIKFIIATVLYDIYNLFIYKIPFKYKRLTCKYKGCIVKGGHGGFNLPPEAYSYYCDRCGAYESNFEGETSFKIYWR